MSEIFESVEEMLRRRVAELEAQMCWIPVDDRQPEADGYYLTKIKKRIDIIDLTVITHAVVYYSQDYDWDVMQDTYVISWMALDLPVEEA